MSANRMKTGIKSTLLKSREIESMKLIAGSELPRLLASLSLSLLSSRFYSLAFFGDRFLAGRLVFSQHRLREIGFTG